MAQDVRIVLMTAPDEETAERIAGLVVERRLAACATILPGARSIYRWEGEVQRDPEVQVILKTEADSVDALCDAIVAEHPYDVPECVALPVTGGFAPYLSWVTSEVERG